MGSKQCDDYERSSSHLFLATSIHVCNQLEISLKYFTSSSTIALSKSESRNQKENRVLLSVLMCKLVGSWPSCLAVPTKSEPPN